MSAASEPVLRPARTKPLGSRERGLARGVGATIAIYAGVAVFAAWILLPVSTLR